MDKHFKTVKVPNIEKHRKNLLKDYFYAGGLSKLNKFLNKWSLKLVFIQFQA